MSDQKWSTAITSIKPNEVRLRGYRLDELMGERTFAECVYLALKGELPPKGAGRLLDAVLVSSIDHGVTPPSTLAARTAASTGAPLNAAISAGILSINRFHGAAIEGCMALIERSLARKEELQLNLEAVATAIVSEHREAKRRLPGLGHRIHNSDPRTARLFQLAREIGIAGDGIAMIQSLRNALAAEGVDLPINVDGAIAAVLTDLGLPREIANAFFMMARVPGMVAHVHEEQTRERPMRTIHPEMYAYDGPAPRPLGE
jgi:citrate synthase